MNRIAIVYYSRKGENYVSGGIKKLKKGNTEVVAEFIGRATGGDIFEIDTVKPYPENYHACTEEAKDEIRRNARPELKEIPDISGYDIVFIGYPNWWGTMPMAMFTFLEGCDWTGKKIVPFCTNEGSGFGRSVGDLKKLCKRAEIAEGLAVFGHRVESSEKTISDWAKQAIQ